MDDDIKRPAPRPKTVRKVHGADEKKWEHVRAATADVDDMRRITAALGSRTEACAHADFDMSMIDAWAQVSPPSNLVVWTTPVGGDPSENAKKIYFILSKEGLPKEVTEAYEPGMIEYRGIPLPSVLMARRGKPKAPKKPPVAVGDAVMAASSSAIDVRPLSGSADEGSDAATTARNILTAAHTKLDKGPDVPQSAVACAARVGIRLALRPGDKVMAVLEASPALPSRTSPEWAGVLRGTTDLVATWSTRAVVALAMKVAHFVANEITERCASTLDAQARALQASALEREANRTTIADLGKKVAALEAELKASAEQVALLRSSYVESHDPAKPAKAAKAAKPAKAPEPVAKKRGAVADEGARKRIAEEEARKRAAAVAAAEDDDFEC